MAAQEALRWRYGNVDDGNFTLRGGGGGVPLLGALLLVLICFVAVCIYLRWACKRYYRPRYPASSSSSPPTSAAPVSSTSARGLDDATIAAFPVTMYRPAGPGGAADDAAQCCPICLGEFAEGDRVKALPRCGHGFHPDCVEPWLRARASCPLCRASLLVATKQDDVVGSEAV